MRHTFVTVLSDNVAYFVTNNRGKLMLILSDFQQPGVHANFTARQCERVHLFIIKNNDFPLPVKNTRRNLRGNRVCNAFYVRVLHGLI